MTTTNNTPAVAFPTVRMHHATRAKAGRIADMLAREYPGLELHAIEGDAVDHETFEVELAGWNCVHVAGDLLIWEGDKLPELADLLDAAQEAGLTEEDLAGEQDDEDEGAPQPASVVDPAYRAQYAEKSSNGQGNGDWLHETLVGYCASPSGFDVDCFADLLRQNDVEPGNTGWGQNRNRGWQGRFRMSGRIVLEKAVALRGFLQLGGTRYDETSDDAAFVAFLGDMRAKHAKALAKAAREQAKRDAIAEAAAGKPDTE